MIGYLAHAVMASAWGRYVMAGLALLAGLSAWSQVQKREGRRQEVARTAVNNIKTLRRMANAAANVWTDSASVSDRLRHGKF